MLGGVRVGHLVRGAVLSDPITLGAVPMPELADVHLATRAQLLPAVGVVAQLVHGAVNPLAVLLAGAANIIKQSVVVIFGLIDNLGGVVAPGLIPPGVIIHTMVVVPVLVDVGELAALGHVVPNWLIAQGLPFADVSESKSAVIVSPVALHVEVRHGALEVAHVARVVCVHDEAGLRVLDV